MGLFIPHTYTVQIATPSCLEHLIQRRESKYYLRLRHRVSVQCFETYYMKNSFGRAIVWNLLEPSAVSLRDYAKRAKRSPALRNFNFSEESPQMGPQIDSETVGPVSQLLIINSVGHKRTRTLFE